MSKYSYESILSAVGRVLDEAGARSFAIREHDSGLLVEASAPIDAQPLSFTFDVADLVALVERQSARDTRDNGAPHYERTYAHDDGTLRHVLKRREPVGAGR